MQDFFGRWMHDAVILAAAVGCLTSAIRGRTRRLAWGVVAAGLLATAPMTLVMKAGQAVLPPHERHPLPPRRVTMRAAGLLEL